MKKYRNFLIILFILMMIPIIIKTFQKKHNVEYKVGKYNINEKFYIEEKSHNYEFKITNKNETYSFILNSNVNKRKKIIKDIKIYKKNNIKCIIPIYVKDISKDIYCLENNNQVSNYYLKDNDNFKSIIEDAKKYKVNLPSDSEKYKEFKKIKVYQNNINDNTAYIIWNYKGIYLLKNNELKQQKFLNYDLYDNIMSTTTSNYFVLFENSNVMGIEKIHYYDIKNDKYNIFKLKDKISKDSYINGVYDDLIYVTDNKKKIQYTINVKKEKIEEVGKEELGYIKYTNNKKEEMNKSDFFMKEQLFDNEKIENKKITNSKDLVKEDQIYYYLDNNKFYKNINGYNSILLFELDNIKDWKINNKDLIIFVDDLVYIYNDELGLRKIIEYNELNYNYKNIVKYWK